MVETVRNVKQRMANLAVVTVEYGHLTKLLTKSMQKKHAATNKVRSMRTIAGNLQSKLKNGKTPLTSNNTNALRNIKDRRRKRLAK